MRAFIGFLVLFIGLLVADQLLYHGLYLQRFLATGQHYGLQLERTVSYWFHRAGF